MWRKGRREALDGLDDEIRDHIEAETLENVARGMSETHARAAALKKFGNVTRIKEDVRDVWVWAWADRLRQDLRDVLRRFRRNPAFALTVSLTLVPRSASLSISNCPFNSPARACIDFMPLPFPAASARKPLPLSATCNCNIPFVLVSTISTRVASACFTTLCSISL